MRDEGGGLRIFVPLIALLAQLVVGSAIAQAQFDHEHAAWTALLKKHVVLLDGGKASQVRYAGFQQDRAALKSYMIGRSTTSSADAA